jgi:RNA recognition motif-containing protein
LRRPFTFALKQCEEKSLMQIYVGNLPEEVTDAELRSMFEKYGKVRSATIGDEKGYGFVEMPVKSEGRAAIEAWRGKEIKGKPLRVRALKPGDDFHSHAMSLQRGAGVKGAPRFRGNVGNRGAGAIRRGGQRGS